MAAKEKRDKNRFGDWKQFLRVLPELRVPWFWIILAFVAYQFYNQALLLLPTNTARLMSGELSGGALTDYIWYYVGYLTVITAQMLLRYQANCISVRRARESVWGGMLRIRMEYYDTHNPSDLMSTLTNDVTSALTSLVGLAVTLLPDIYYLVLAMKTIGDYSFWLLLSIFGLLPIKILNSVFIGRWTFKTQVGVYREIGGLTGYLAERIRHMSLIKAYTNEKAELKNGETASHKLYDANMRVVKLSCVQEALALFITLLEKFAVIFSGVILLQKDMITMEQWISFFLFSSTINSKFTLLIDDWISAKSLQGTISRTVALMNAPREKVETGKTQEVPREAENAVGTEIVFDKVSFAYGDRKALRKVSFTVPEGSTTAIVGLCGSGKTTSLSLMERFYEPTEGEVRIGGVSVSVGSLSEHRKRFSYVQQGSDIFGGTVREAITYGIRRDVTDEEIWDAAERSGFAAYLKAQPEGLDAPVAPRGASMSGGQRQRLVLAREFLRNAEILLLDEPTSALDVETAQAVQQTLLSMFAGKTTVLVTHDLRLLAGVDHIIVLRDGVLEGCGTYAQLSNSCPLFREMVEKQNCREEVIV